MVIQQDDKIILVGYFNRIGSLYKGIIRLNPDGTKDQTFNIGNGANNYMKNVCIQNDGKIIVIGDFTTFNGSVANKIVRLNPNGSVDNTFNTGSGPNKEIYSVTTDANDKIIVCGKFTSFNGINVGYLASLNDDGSVNSNSSVGANNIIYEARVQIDNKILIYGEFSSYNNSPANKIARLNSDGTIDQTFVSGNGFDTSPSSIELQSDNKILLGGNFTTYNNKPNNRLIRLNVDGSIDSTYYTESGPSSNVFSILFHNNTNTIYIGGIFSRCQNYITPEVAHLKLNGRIDQLFSSSTGANNKINSISIQPDEKIIIAGTFSEYNYDATAPIIRVNKTGELDTTFRLWNNGESKPTKIIIQPDNKILYAAASGIYRINSDGSKDNSLDIQATNIATYERQKDGKLIIGGNAYFASYKNLPSKKIIRVLDDGSLDNSFNFPTNAALEITAITIQKDGKILLGGSFIINAPNDTNNQSHCIVMRLQTDGSIDTTFHSGIGFYYQSYIAEIKQILVQPNQKILVIGTFDSYNGVPIAPVVRLTANGSIDNSFQNNINQNYPWNCIALQSNGKILLGGSKLMRFNYDGRLDTTFITGSGPNSTVNSLIIDKEGKIVIGGDFTSYNNIGKNRIARIFGDSTISNCDKIQLHFENVNDINCSQSISNVKTKAYYGTAPYEYHWLNAPSLNDSISNISNAGSYTAVVIDALGCEDTATLMIKSPKYLLDFDLENSSLSNSSMRPGLSYVIKFNASNIGCTATSGELKLTLNSLLTFNNSTPSPDKISGDTLIWNFSNLQYLSTPFTPQINVTTSNSAQIGDTIHLKTIITPITGDADITNNIKDYYYPVINGYDPNDIQVNPRGNCAKNYISNNQTLTYTVRFQNTGNAEAINIAVLDSLSSNLDVNTLRVLASSDTMYTMILPNNVVKFMFDNIMLADSNSNEPASHGYVVFEIKPKANLSNETKIENRADIYFDFNPAVLTNTVFNTITDGSAYPCILTSVEKIENKNSTLYPNPSAGIFTLTSSSIAQNITVYDQTGRSVLSIIPTQNTTSIDLGNVSNGMYFIQVKSNESVQVLKAVVQK